MSSSSMLNHNSQVVLVISVIFTTVSCHAIRNATSIENSTETFEFPDWVPFKNKHGEELGEFKPVPKPKPKKRLALPANFVLRPLSDDSDDYYEKSMGQSEDNYEFKDWSDTNRPAAETNVTVNHTDVSDIDDVVNIIISPSDRTKLAAEIEKSHNNFKTDDRISSESAEDSTEKPDKRHASGEEETDYEDTEKRKAEAEAEHKENVAKKAFILNSVDELKARHTEEARALSEKMKEEETYKEELERDKVSSEERDKYGHIAHHKLEYDDYDSREAAYGDKYKIHPLRKKMATTKQPARASKRKTLIDSTTTKSNHNDGKLSFFKNPRAYMVFDDEDETETHRVTTTVAPATKEPYSSRHRKNKHNIKPTSSEDADVRIKFVAADVEGKDEEPTLFFPITHKKRKNKKSGKKHSKKEKEKKKHIEKDLGATLYQSTSKIIQDSEKSLPVPTASGSDESLKISLTGEGDSGPGNSGEDLTSPSAPEGLSVELPAKYSTVEKPIEDSKEVVVDSALSAASAPAAIADTHLASTDHHKEAHKDHKYEKGGEKEHVSEHESSMGEHGKKAYEGLHKDTKNKKVHHDKEDHSGVYHDHGGHDQSHHDEKKHHAEHHHEEHGNKRAKYEESGKHSKGHSTKGSHDIHKKEEYEKKVEFFEEDGDSAEEEKHGGHGEEKKHTSGGKYKKGDLQSQYGGHTKEDSGHSQKGGHDKGYKAHHLASGHDAHQKRGSSHSSSDGRQSDKKWIYHHGHPARTANLVVIDRRGDQYYHGPQYYG